MWYNSIITALLRSPLHRLLSRSLMLITVTGRRSGRQYTTPVSYVRDENYIWFISRRQRIWWRNLSDGAPVTLWLRGKEVTGKAYVIEGDPDEHLEDLKEHFSAIMKADQLEELAPDLVLVEIELDEASSGKD